METGFRNSSQSFAERERIGDPLQSGIEDEMAAVRDESKAGLVAAERQRARISRGFDGCGDSPLGSAEAERHDFDREREAAERFDPFRGVGDHNHPRGSRRHDLLAQQRSAPALDQGQVRGNLVGAVNREVELGRIVERGQLDAAFFRLRARRLGGRHRDHVEAGAHALAQHLDERPGGRSGAEPEPHARLDELEGTGRGVALVGVGVHCRCSSGAGLNPDVPQ
jgi:hypothetical protein